jgi:hypothetical protein
MGLIFTKRLAKRDAVDGTQSCGRVTRDSLYNLKFRILRALDASQIPHFPN